MPDASWYSTLIKPNWAPPSWLFGPVWSVLYVIIFISYGSVFAAAAQRRIPWMIALPFALNLVFNFLFTPIQFGLRNNLLATADILLVVGTLVWSLVGIRENMPWVTYVNIPYLLWGTFATVLQTTITYLNR